MLPTRNCALHQCDRDRIETLIKTHGLSGDKSVVQSIIFIQQPLPSLLFTFHPSNSYEFPHRIHRLHQMHIRHLVSPSSRQRMRSTHCILNLSPVDFLFCQLRNLFIAYYMLSPGFDDERLPYLHLGCMRELREVQGNMDTREEGFVEYLYAIGGEEEDASVVLDVSEAVKEWEFGVSPYMRRKRRTIQPPWRYALNHGANVVQGRHQPVIVHHRQPRSR